MYLQINVSQLLQNLTLLFSIFRQLISEGAGFDLHCFSFYIRMSLYWNTCKVPLIPDKGNLVLWKAEKYPFVFIRMVLLKKPAYSNFQVTIKFTCKSP